MTTTPKPQIAREDMKQASGGQDAVVDQNVKTISDERFERAAQYAFTRYANLYARLA